MVAVTLHWQTKTVWRYFHIFSKIIHEGKGRIQSRKKYLEAKGMKPPKKPSKINIIHQCFSLAIWQIIKVGEGKVL